MKQAEWRTDPEKAGIAGAIGDIGSHAENLVSTVTGLEMYEICADLTSFVPGRQLDDDGNLVGSGDVRAQTRQTLHNLMRQLAAAGAGGEDVLKTTVYVASTDRADLVACWEEVQRSPLAAAASTLLGVALLGYTGQLVEIEAIAVLP